MSVVNIIVAMDELKKIGRNIALLRKKQKLTQEDFANLAGMDRSYLSEIENGHKNPSVTTLLSISQALNVSVQTLLEGIENDSSN